MEQGVVDADGLAVSDRYRTNDSDYDIAAAPNGQVIYVGNENVTSGGYWTTDDDGNVTASTAGDTPTDNYIHYDAENNVLTLHNATIKKGLDYNESIQGGTYINGSAIGVFNQNGDAELTITLEGTNTIAEVGKGIFVLASSASTGSSNLTIQGDGSLNASASQTGIWVQSNSNNAALCVENAEVTASSDVAFKNGVLVQAKDGSDVSLTVNGGSLTASVNANIWFQFGSGTSGSGTPTVTVSNNAIVRANGGIANNSSSPIQYETGSDSTGGIVFDGKNGTVYGSVTLQEDITIGEGESLTLDDGASLNTGSYTVTVNGGTLNGEDKITGSTIYAPTITTQPISQTVEEGNPATFTITASGSDLRYQWQKSADNGISWIKADGETVEATYAIEAATTGMNGLQYRCVVWNDAGSVNSDAATLTVDAHKHSLKHYEYKAPTCTENGNEEYWYCESCKQYFSDENATMPITQEDTVIAATGHAYGDPTWEWSKDGQSATATFICDNDESHQENKEASITSTVKEEPTCTEDGITVYTATVEFNGQTYMDAKEIADLSVTGHQLTKVDGKVQTIEETGNITYWHCEICDKYFSDENGEHEITLEDTIIAKLPKLLEGADQVWTKGSKDGMVWRIQEDPQAFKRVLVDGKELKDTEYTVTSGSTIITLQPSYLETLSAGQHTIRFEFTTGNIETHFTIKDAEKATQSESTDTGLQNHLGLWISICMAAASGLFAMMILVRRKER